MRSGESTRIPHGCGPGSNSILIYESCVCSFSPVLLQVFSPGIPDFPSPQKPTVPIN